MTQSYYERNKERYRQKYQANKEAYLARYKAWYDSRKDDPEFKMRRSEQRRAEYKRKKLGI